MRIPSLPPRLLVLACLLILQTSVRAEVIEADVCIYGGTSAGVIAGIQCIREGRLVVLLEAGQHLGGMSTEGIGGTDVDNHPGFQNSPAVGGLAREFYRRVSARYGRAEAFDQMIRTGGKQPGLWGFEPRIAESVFDDWAKEVGLRVLRDHRLVEKSGVSKEGTKILSIRCENGDEIRAKVFVDTTYEGDLLAGAGVSFEVGREGNAKYGETKNGIRTSTSHGQLDRKLDPYRIPGDPNSGLIVGVQAESVGEAGAANPAIQAFSFRLCMTNNPANRIAIEKPANYKPENYELQRRYLAAGGVISAPSRGLPNGKYGTSWHTLGGSLVGWNHEWNTASYAERSRLLELSREYMQGLHWFMANDPAVPENQRVQWAELGLCKDEFTDHQGWPRMFYPRNGRRMVSDFVMTEAHGRKEQPVSVEDPIGLIWWPHDLHNARRLVKDGKVWNEGAVFAEKADWIPFGHSYRSVVPRRNECTNLLVPTCPSMSYVAYGAFRLEFSFMVAAQSSATAAALALKHSVAVQDVTYEELRAKLLNDGQVLAAP